MIKNEILDVVNARINELSRNQSQSFVVPSVIGVNFQGLRDSVIADMTKYIDDIGYDVDDSFGLKETFTLFQNNVKDVESLFTMNESERIDFIKEKVMMFQELFNWWEFDDSEFLVRGEVIEERKNKTMKVLARDFGFDEALISWKTKDNDRFFNFLWGVIYPTTSDESDVIVPDYFEDETEKELNGLSSVYQLVKRLDVSDDEPSRFLNEVSCLYYTPELKQYILRVYWDDINTLVQLNGEVSSLRRLTGKLEKTFRLINEVKTGDFSEQRQRIYDRIEELAEVYTQWIEGYEDFKAEEITSSKCVSLIERMEEESDKFREFSTQFDYSFYVFISAIYYS